MKQGIVMDGVKLGSAGMVLVSLERQIERARARREGDRARATAGELRRQCCSPRAESPMGAPNLLTSLRSLSQSQSLPKVA